jgi:hypothetical protein
MKSGDLLTLFSKYLAKRCRGSLYKYAIAEASSTKYYLYMFDVITWDGILYRHCASICIDSY